MFKIVRNYESFVIKFIRQCYSHSLLQKSTKKDVHDSGRSFAFIRESSLTIMNIHEQSVDFELTELYKGDMGQ